VALEDLDQLEFIKIEVMKRIVFTALSIALLSSCTIHKFNKIRTNGYKFCVWTVVDKIEVEPGGCAYYWNSGQSSFIDSCEKYNVGDTIKHQTAIAKGRRVRSW
jgi:hypothetical protein